MDVEGSAPSASHGESKGKCYDAPEAPTFYPTTKEFVHPGRYIASIAEAVRPYGICKIVPPSSWKPPFMIDKNKFHFRTKVQQVNYLDGQSRLRLTFVENLCRFLAKQGTPLERLPVVNERVLDLCKLFSEVRKRGGMISVTERKQWSDVARTLGLKPGFGSTLKQHYERILFCYELYKAAEAEKKLQEAKAADETDGAVRHGEKAAKSDRSGIVQTPPESDQNSASAANGSESTTDGDESHGSEEATIPPSPGHHGRKAEGAAIEKESKPSGKQPLRQTPKTTSAGDSSESKDKDGQADDGGSDSDSEFEFGYHDGQKYSLASYKAMADAWKAKQFGRGLGQISEQDVEEKYWDVVLTPEDMVEVEYGSELHTTTHGSGFPTCGNSLNPLDQPHSSSSYCRSPWNLNNLNASTLLRHIRQDIPGILSPWVYVGMCMSSFCWHNEDHYLYSINYLWDGEPKQWYGCSGDDADVFERAMREYAPELFEMQPDLLFQLVTMMSPAELESRGVKVCRMTQRAGEFMLTFPRAYHGGYNVGFNVAESCNFALTDWIPWGRASDLHYRSLCRPQVFSHPGFLVNLAEDDDNVATSMWLLPDLLRYYEEEAGQHQKLIQKGLTQERAMDVKRGGILTTALLEETEDVSNEYLDGKRVCASRMQRMNQSMQEIRRAKQESAVADECAICKASTFFYQKVACVEHAEELCSCPLSQKMVDVRYSPEEFQELIEEVKERAQQPSLWLDKANALLASGAQPYRTYQSVASEADRFESAVVTVTALQEQLREELRRSRSWASRAQELLGAVAENPKASHRKDPEVDVSELEKLEQDGATLLALPEEREEIRALAQRVREWRLRARDVVAGADMEVDALNAVLADGLALALRMPEVKRVQAVADLRMWLHEARPLMSTRAKIERIEELVRVAHEKGLFAPEVQTLKTALDEANTARFKLVKAKERQTGLSALRQVFEKAESARFGGMEVEIPEVQETRERIQLCEEWSARARELLAAERPLLTQLEKVAEEYTSLGAFVEPHDVLRSRVTEGTNWLRKVRRLVGDEMFVGNFEEPAQDDTAMAGVAETPLKRPSSVNGAGAASKRPKKTSSSGGVVARSKVPLRVLKELLEEEKKLKAHVVESKVLAKRVEEFEGWHSQVLGVIQSGSFGRGPGWLSGLKVKGENMGVELGDVGAALEQHIWRAKVAEALRREEKDGQHLSNLKEEGRASGWESADLDVALEAEIRRVKEKGCFCGRVGVNGKLVGPICCCHCGKTFHPECLGLRSAPSTAYTCAGCERKSREVTTVELPSGWQQVVEALGRTVFVHSFTGQALLSPPPGTTAQTTPGLLPFAENPCLSRGAMQGVCQVCFQEDTDTVDCAECGLRVHPSCYGESAEGRGGSPWLCRSCERGVRRPECPLCPLVGGAAKPTLSGGWAHVVCATWVPEVFFEAPERMEPIGGLDAVSKDRRRIPCSICKTRKGAIIQCGKGKCHVSWHPLCGMEAGMYMNLEEDEHGDVQYVTRCEKHKPQEEEEEEDDTLYCVCKQRYVEGEFMIECEACSGWFHPKCVGLSDRDAEALEHWKCPPCLGPLPHAPSAQARAQAGALGGGAIPHAALVNPQQHPHFPLQAVQAAPLPMAIPGLLPGAPLHGAVAMPQVGAAAAVPVMLSPRPLAPAAFTLGVSAPGQMAPGLGRV